MKPSLVAIALAACLISPQAGRAQSLVAGLGAGPSIPQRAVIVGDDRADVDPGYAGRAFVWWTPDTMFAAGMTASHVRAPSGGETSTLSFVGLGGGIGSDPDADAAVFVWASLGVGHSRGACANTASGEFGIRGDRRVSRPLRLGATFALVVVPTGCGNAINDAPSGGSESNAAVLGSALMLSVDLVFELLPGKSRSSAPPALHGLDSE